MKLPRAEDNSVIPFAQGNAGFTPDGGLAVRLTNRTGSPSVRGTLVECSLTHDRAFALTVVNSFSCSAVVYEDAVADGEQCWVVVSGLAYVKLKNNVCTTRGNWCGASDTVGRADGTVVGGPPSVPQHNREIGHILETVAGDPAGALALCNLHFN